MSGIFSPAGNSELEALLGEAGIEMDGGELIVEREIGANGKSRAFVGNRPVTTAFLRQLAPALGDIHGQNEQQLLFTAPAQRQLLDEYAGSLDLRAQVAAAFAEQRRLEEKLEELNKNEQERLRQLDLWIFQRKEIESVQPQAREDEELEAERKILQNMTRLQENSAAAYAMLYDSPESATTQLRKSLKRLDDLTRHRRKSRRNGGGSEAGCAAGGRGRVRGSRLPWKTGKRFGTPGRHRKQAGGARSAEKKVWPDDWPSVLAFGVDVAKRIEEVENASENRAALEKQRDAAAEKYVSLAGELTRKRDDSGGGLEPASGERTEEPDDGSDAISDRGDGRTEDRGGHGRNRVSRFAQPRRRSEAARKDRIGRRVIAHCARAQDRGWQCREDRARSRLWYSTKLTRASVGRRRRPWANG